MSFNNFLLWLIIVFMVYIFFKSISDSFMRVYSGLGAFVILGIVNSIYLFRDLLLSSRMGFVLVCNDFNYYGEGTVEVTMFIVLLSIFFLGLPEILMIAYDKVKGGL